MSQKSNAVISSHTQADGDSALIEASTQVFLNPSCSRMLLPTLGQAPLLSSSFERLALSINIQAPVSSIGIDASWRPMLGPLVTQSIIGVSNLPAQQAPFLPMTTLAAHPLWPINRKYFASSDARMAPGARGLPRHPAAARIRFC